ncbi:MAG TPA: hypothetical protein VKU40_03865 [Thermoanaerobaculia bacterium]|nr:hypothetical protein [Thermoanaerobaculia bacterium]
MKRAITLLAVMLMVGVAAVSLSAQDGETPTLEETVLALLELPRAERIAALKAMSPEERLGVWYAVKKAEVESLGTEESPSYADRLSATSSRRAESSARAAAEVEKLVGTITYDDNVITNTFGGGAIIGNRFDTHTGSTVLTSGSVSQVQAVVVQGPAFSSDSAGFVITGPQTMGGGAMAIFSTFTSGMTGTTSTLTYTGFNASYTANSFFVLFGDFASVYVPAFGTGSTNTQGHHGVVGYTGGMGPNITSTFDFGGALNALVRATGNIVPVELMSFDVD